MGLLGVNVRLLYGEGCDKGFAKLQLEIKYSHDDESIFAWTASRSLDRSLGTALAQSTEAFAEVGNIHHLIMLLPRTANPIMQAQQRPNYSITNKEPLISAKSRMMATGDPLMNQQSSLCTRIIFTQLFPRINATSSLRNALGGASQVSAIGTNQYMEPTANVLFTRSLVSQFCTNAFQCRARSD